MKIWEIYEQESFKEIQKIYPQAILFGGKDSTRFDVKVDDFFIDIKMERSQCSQFVINENNTFFEKRIINGEKTDILYF